MPFSPLLTKCVHLPRPRIDFSKRLDLRGIDRTLNSFSPVIRLALLLITVN